ncbi:hypothetical protein AVEN_135770-1 [Araneus ventricosus]|uniref:Uncharacterized protein n=1 Tax=Araneus ventricosus TaxID=182803 RepID=A0A4Y2CAJ6_ARAVE|nr:hypothetical protein AVEN_135770-1 [Araneus ventricosus]
MSLSRNVSLMVGKRHLQRFLQPVGGWRLTTPYLGDKLGDRFDDSGEKIKVPQNAGIFSISLLGSEIYRIYKMILCDVTSCQETYKKPGVAERRQSSLNVFGVRRISLESCSHRELISY